MPTMVPNKPISGLLCEYSGAASRNAAKAKVTATTKMQCFQAEARIDWTRSAEAVHAAIMAALGSWLP